MIAYARAALDLLWPPLCPRCGARADAPRDHFCERCWSSLRAATVEPADTPVHCAFSVDALFLDVLATSKYRRFRRVGLRLAREAAARLSASVPEGVCVPVPLTGAKRRERGFNQTEDVADALCHAARAANRELVVDARLLRRTKGGKALAGKAPEVRAAAVRHAFVADPRVAELGVILVDDVVTTGSTLRECTRAIETAGGRVLAWVAMGRAGGAASDVPALRRETLGNL